MDTEGDLIRNFELLRSYLTHDEGKPTATSEEQVGGETTPIANGIFQ